MQLADYALIANSVPDNVKIMSPQDIEQQKQTIASLALSNQARKIENSTAQAGIDRSALLKAAIQANAKPDQSGRVVVDHNGVINTLAQKDAQLASEYEQHHNEQELLKSKSLYDRYSQQIGQVAQLAQGVMSQPEQARPQAYQSALAQAKQLGIDVTGAPSQYDQNYLTGIINQAVSVKDHFEADQAKELEALKAKNHAAVSGEGDNVFLNTPDGYIAANKRTTAVKPLINQETGKPYMASSADVDLHGQLSGASTAAKEKAEAISKAKQSLPQIENTADSIEGNIKELLSHPGRGAATGLGSVAPAIPGTDQAGFISRLDQIKGQAFLEAFNQLRGAGAITEAEGQKASQSISRLNRNLKPSEFEAAAKDLIAIVEKGRKKAREAANGAQFDGNGGGGQGSMTPVIVQGKPSLDDIFGGN